MQFIMVKREIFMLWSEVKRLPPRSAVVAFSAAEVYTLAEMLRRQRGGTTVSRFIM